MPDGQQIGDPNPFLALKKKPENPFLALKKKVGGNGSSFGVDQSGFNGRLQEDLINRQNQLLQQKTDVLKPVSQIQRDLYKSQAYDELKNTVTKDGWEAKAALAELPVQKTILSDALIYKAKKYDEKTSGLRNIPAPENLKEANDLFLSQNYSPQLKNEAVKYYANKNASFGKNLKAAGIDINDPQLATKLPNFQVGKAVNEYVQDPDIRAYAEKENPNILPAVQNLANTNLKENPDFAVNQIANEVSNEVAKSGFYNIDPLIGFHGEESQKYVNQTAEQLYRDDPEKLAIYNEKIRNNQKEWIAHPSFLANTAEAIKNWGKGLVNTVTEPFTSEKQSVKEQWEKEAKNVTADTKGWLKFLSASGDVTGFVIGLMATGNVSGLSSTNALTLGTTGDIIEDARNKYRGEPIKAATSAALNVAMYRALGKDIFPADKVKKALEKVKPELNTIVENLANGAITKEAARREAQSTFGKAIEFAGGTAAKDIKIASELTGLTILNREMDRLMMDEKDFKEHHPDEEVLQSFEHNILGNLFIAGLGKYGEMKNTNRVVSESLYRAASNPQMAEKLINKASLELSYADVNEAKDNLKYIATLKQTLDAGGISEKNQKRFIFEALKEKVKKETEPDTGNEVIDKKKANEIKEHQKVQEDILNGKDVQKGEPDLEPEIKTHVPLPEEKITTETPSGSIGDESKPIVRVTAEQLEERQPEKIRQRYIDDFNIVEDSKFDWRVTSQLSTADRKKAVSDIKAGKDTAAARKLNQEMDEMLERGTVIINRGRGNQAETVEIPIDEWFKFTPIEQDKAIKAAESAPENVISIINEEGITLQNIDNLKDLFNGFPYDQTDFNNVKNYLQGETTRNAEIARTGEKIQQEKVSETIPSDTKSPESKPTEEKSQPETATTQTGKAAEPPTGEPPKETVGEGERPESDKRRFTQQMLRDEEIVPKEEISKTLDYAKQKNKMSVSEAADILNKVGVDEAQNLVINDKELKGAVRVTLAQVVIKKYNELAKNATNEVEKNHYLDKTIQTAEYTTEKLATEPGQMIQAFSMWSQLSPEAQLRAANQDIAKQAQEKIRRRKKDVDTIANKFKKANEEAANEVLSDKDVKETEQKQESEKIKKAKDKITKAREKRASIIKKYKGGKGKNLFSSPLGLTTEGIEFVGDIARTYIEEGVANLEILAQKIIAHLEEVAGKKPSDEIKKQVNDIADKEFNKADMSLLGKALKDSNVKIGTIVKEHYTNVERAKKNLAQKLMDEAGMEQSNAKEYAKKVEAAFDRIATRKKRNILYHEKARFDKIQKTFQNDKRADPKTIQSEIIKYSNLGAFENSDLSDMLADKFGLKKLTPEQAAKLNELSEKIQKAPEGKPKDDATEDLLAYRANIRGNDLMETAQAVWYANILSGYKTHEKNVVSTFFNSMGELGSLMMSDPKSIPYVLGGYIKGVSRRGLVEAAHTLATGRSPIHIKKIETPTTLERKNFSFLGLKGGWNPANWFKYVTRLMVAEDVLSFQGLKEARAYQLARREAQKMGFNTWTKKGWDKVNELLFHTRERWLTAQDQAETEGLKPNSREWKRRIYELMESSRPVEMTEDAYDFAAHGTFNYESKGTLGAFTNAVAHALDVNVGGLKPARFVVPFTRIITNVVNNSLDFTPVGLIRAVRGVRGFRTFEEGKYTKGAFKELSGDERKRLVAKAMTGIAFAATFQALHLAGALTLTGGGPDDKKKKQQLKEQGWEEYSVKIGGKWYSYKYTPLVFILGFLGNMNDAEKYGEDDDKTFAKKVQMSALRFGNQVVDMTWINSAGTFLGALADGTPAEQGKKVNDALSGMARGFIPFSQAITQSTQAAEKIFNMPAKQVNNSWQALIQDIPIARNSLSDKINALGEPVTRDIDVLTSKENPDPVWKFLEEKQGWVATLSKNSVNIFDQKTKQDRPITDDEFYELAKRRGGKIRADIEKMIVKGFPVIRNSKEQIVSKEDIKPKELNEVLSKIEAQATKDTKEELFGEKPIDKKEQGIRKKWNEKINSIILK